MSQVVSEAEAHHREEQNLRKLGIENQDSKVKKTFCEPAKIPLPGLEKSHGTLSGSSWRSVGIPSVVRAAPLDDRRL